MLDAWNKTALGMMFIPYRRDRMSKPLLFNSAFHLKFLSSTTIVMVGFARPSLPERLFSETPDEAFMVGALSFASPSHRGFHWFYNPKVENPLLILAWRIGKSSDVIDNFPSRMSMVDSTAQLLEKTMTFQ